MTALNGQIIGQTEHATRAVLDRLLARTGTTFHEWVALNQTAAAGGQLDAGALIARMVAGLKIDEPVAGRAVLDLTSVGLLEPGPDDAGPLSLTPAGHARFREISSEVREVTARLYGDIPTEDLAVAARVLTLITARADAELSPA